MTVYQVQPERTDRPTRPDWRQSDGGLGEPAGVSRGRVVLLSLLLLLVAVLCVAAFLILRVFFPRSLSGVLPGLGLSTPTGSDLASGLTALPSGTDGEAKLVVNPTQGGIGTLVTVTGRGWLPGEPVFVFLRSPGEAAGQGYSYAAAVADSSGDLHTAFTFPSEQRWVGQPWADVTARGTRSGLQATVRFALAAPSPTNTLLPTVRTTPLPTSTPVPTPTPTPTATPTPIVVITDWRAEYYANPSLSGSPALIRNDVDINFDWGAGAPDPSLPADGFSVRWTRTLGFRAGLYRFTAGADDGVRLWVDGLLLVDEWHDGPFTLYATDLGMNEGGHSVQLEYYENYGGARVLLAWEEIVPPTLTPTPTATATATPEPTSTPTPTPTSSPPPPVSWQGEYYANPDLNGLPVLVREDPQLDFDWGHGAPAEGLPDDGFSVRWTQDTWMATGTYRISIDVDDGVRLWVDDLLLIDQWYASGGATYSTDWVVLEGSHRLRVEYFEDTGKAWIRCRIEAAPGLAAASP